MIQDAINDIIDNEKLIAEEIDLIIDKQGPLSKNINKVFSLKDGSIKTKSTKPKGRPVMHSFGGRVTLLRSEVEAALEDGPAFVEMMSENHQIDEKRMAELIANEIVDPNVNQFFYTFMGNIDMVLEEVEAVNLKYHDQVEAGKCKIRNDFKKKRIITDPDKPLYVAPIRNGDVIEKIEVYPDIVYGYVEITLLSK